MALLRVPYYRQPNGYTCQSSCIKMFASYLEQKRGISIYEDKEQLVSVKGSQLDIMKIWNEINFDEDRAQKWHIEKRKSSSGRTIKKKVRVRNYWNNFVWWLDNHCPDLDFETDAENDTRKAAQRFKKYIDEGYPVMVGTKNTHAGHIILVIGYEIDDSTAALDMTKMDFICHDPWGKAYSFNVEKKSWRYARRKRRTDHLTSQDIRRKLICGGEVGVGKSVEYDYKRIGKMKNGADSTGVYRILYVKV